MTDPDEHEIVCDICETAFGSERDLLVHDCDEFRETPSGWVVQQGLGDASARGQTTLDGGIQPPERDRS